jgi:predicted permease
MRPRHWIYLAPLRLWSLFRRRRADADLDAELRDHLDHKTQAYIASGLPPQQARRQALIDLGGLDRTKEECRDVRGTHFIEPLLQDTRYAFRMLRKSPGFTSIAVLTLALGIGANTAIFSIVDAVLLRPLPFRNPSRLVMIGESFPSLENPRMGAKAKDFTIYQREQKSLQSVGAFQDKHFDLSGSGEPEDITGARVSASIFPMLGVQPFLGRAFTAQEDKPGANVVVLSYGLWQRHYAGSREIIGKTITLNRLPYTVIGVMPKGFQFPIRGPQVFPPENSRPADVWMPMAFTPEDMSWDALPNNLLLGRLKPGITIEQAQAEANLLAIQIERQYPADLLKSVNDARLHIWVSSFHSEVVSSVRTLLLVLMAAVGMVLLIACANVATLLLSRATSRQREMVIRSALGASPLRLARQMLTESLMLALAGGAIGILIARSGAGVLLSLVPSSVPLTRDVSFGGSILLFAAVVCCLTAVIFGVAPAFQSSTISLQASLQEAGRSGTPGHKRSRLQGTFVIAEFALAFVLLIAAGLLIRSFSNLLRSNPGFRPDHILTMSVPLPSETYSKAAEVRNFYEQLGQRVGNLPGVRSAAITTDLPLKGLMDSVMQIQGRPGFTPLTMVTWALGNYFAAMGIPLIQGRFFTPQDRAGSHPVVIISDVTAKKFWPGGDALGKRVGIAGTPGVATIIGIVGNVNNGPLGSVPSPHAYVPYLQLPDSVLMDKEFTAARSMTLVVRTSTDPSAITSAVVANVHSLDSQLAVANIRTMAEEVNSSVAGPKFDTFLLGFFAFLALFLAAIGIYGVLAYTTVQRTHEIGVRIALGAQREEVSRLILGQGARLALLGVGLGVVIAVGLTRLMASLLFGVSATDPLTFVVVATVLVGIGMLACYIPARRAMRVDPMVALRYE